MAGRPGGARLASRAPKQTHHAGGDIETHEILKPLSVALGRSRPDRRPVASDDYVVRGSFGSLNPTDSVVCPTGNFFIVPT